MSTTPRTRNGEKQAERELDELVALLFAIGRLFRGDGRRPMSGACSYLQLSVLRYIAETGTPTMKDLSAHFAITAPSATALVESLVSHRFVRRLPDARDRRIVRLAATASGDRALRESMARKATRLKEALRRLSLEERVGFAASLSKLARAE